MQCHFTEWYCVISTYLICQYGLQSTLISICKIVYLYSFYKLVKDFCGVVSEASVRSNLILIMELINEYSVSCSHLPVLICHFKVYLIKQLLQPLLVFSFLWLPKWYCLGRDFYFHILEHVSKPWLNNLI